MTGPRTPARVAALLDRQVDVPVVVFGSMPDEARDLDLLVSPDGYQQLRTALEADGFRRDGNAFVRFADCGVEAVDLAETERFGLDAGQARRLVTESWSLPPYRHLRRPSPHHTLLLLARQAVGDGCLPPGRRARAQWAMAHAGAWARSADLAPRWGATRALDVLDGLLAGQPPGRRARAAALAELSSASARPRLARARAWRHVLRRPTGHLIAVSGLDGSGKSTQVAALTEQLAALGHETVSVWTRLGNEAWLDRVALPVKGLLARLTGRPWETRVPAAEPVVAGGTDRRAAYEPAELDEPGGVWRRAVRDAWALFVAVANGVAHRRATAGHLRAGRVVVCDRYVLDSTVHLRYRYAPHRSLSLHAAVLRWLSPTPTHTILLAITGTTAWRRKQDHYVERQLRLQATLYEQEWRRCGAHRLDGTATREELCARTAEGAWRAMRQSSRSHGVTRGLVRRLIR